jgi:hypothetical protein
LEEEPRCEVVKNGVLFKPLDIKALISQAYVKALTFSMFAGGRCNEFEPERDQYGGYKDRECRDISPGLF